MLDAVAAFPGMGVGGVAVFVPVRSYSVCVHVHERLLGEGQGGEVPELHRNTFIGMGEQLFPQPV